MSKGTKAQSSLKKRLFMEAHSAQELKKSTYVIHIPYGPTLVATH